MKVVELITDIFENQVAVTMNNMKAITVGSTSADKALFLSGRQVPNFMAYIRNSNDNAEEINHRFVFPTSSKTTVPVPIDDARKLISEYISSSAFTNPLVVYTLNETMESDSVKRMYLGVRKVGESYSVFELTPQGTVSAAPKLDSLVQEFMSESNIYDNDDENEQEQDSVLPPEGHVFSRYDILSDSVFKTDGSSSTITMEVTFEGLHEPLCPPPSSSNVVLKIRACPGTQDPENHTATSHLLKELKKLEVWDQIRRTGEWVPEGGSSSNNGKEAPLSTRVDAFLENIKLEGGSCVVETSQDGHNLDTRGGHGGAGANMVDLDSLDTLPERKDMDFVERVWKFVQAAHHLEDLTDALTGIIEELETGRLLPMVSKSNHTTFANVIRDLLKLHQLQTVADIKEQKESISRMFDYWLESPLDILVEAGISKLRRDYCHYLLGNDLANYNQLDAFLDASLDLTQQIRNLTRLHRVLELWCLVKNNILSIPYETLRGLVQAALEEFRKEAVQSSAINYDDDAQDDEQNSANSSIVDRRVVYYVSLPKFAGGTGKVVGSLVRSFQPTVWSLALTDAVSSTAGATTTTSNTALNRVRMITYLKEDDVFKIETKTSLLDFDPESDSYETLLGGSGKKSLTVGDEAGLEAKVYDVIVGVSELF